MGSKEEFIEGLGAAEPVPVGRPGALSAVEALATLDWYGNRDDPRDEWIKAVQEVVAQLHESNVHQTHKWGFCPSCAENYLACNLLAGKLDL